MLFNEFDVVLSVDEAFETVQQLKQTNRWQVYNRLRERWVIAMFNAAMYRVVKEWAANYYTRDQAIDTIKLCGGEDGRPVDEADIDESMIERELKDGARMFAERVYGRLRREGGKVSWDRCCPGGVEAEQLDVLLKGVQAAVTAAELKYEKELQN